EPALPVVGDVCMTDKLNGEFVCSDFIGDAFPYSPIAFSPVEVVDNEREIIDVATGARHRCALIGDDVRCIGGTKAAGNSTTDGVTDDWRTIYTQVLEHPQPLRDVAGPIVAVSSGDWH